MTGYAPPSPRSNTAPSDRGSTLLMVLVTMTVLALMVSVGLNHALGSVQRSDRSADWKQALAAAESGVDDYLSRLNRNDNYWRTADCGNVALRGDPAVTQTVSNCSWGSGTALGWRAVDGAPGAQFHYDVDVSETAVNGTILLRSTGRVNGVTRTVQSILRRGGFGEFLYYTVYETVDPANEAVYGTNNSYAQRNCARYHWADPARPVATRTDPAYLNYTSYYCQAIQFGGADRINGPLHTNDTMLISGAPRFTGTTSTSDPSCQSTTGAAVPATRCYRASGSANPTFAKGISYHQEIGLPTSIGDLRQYVTPGGVAAARLGCLYTGPTRIKFSVSGGAAQMTVWSPWSGRSGGAALNPGCGSTTNLRSSAGATVAVPSDKLILVQDVPQAQSSPPSGACATGAIGDDLPVASDFNSTLDNADCRYGTLYTEGTFKGRLTMSTDNNIVVTGDLTYAGGDNGTDALGLIAGNSVNVYHPVDRTQYCEAYDSKNRCTRTAYRYRNLNRNGNRPVLQNVSVNAAILTLQHSFGVQSYQYGAQLGTLKVYGSIAQRFRGPVGTTAGTGYAKNYIYDTRLRYAPPPYFLDPVKSGWGQKVFGETTPRYS